MAMNLGRKIMMQIPRRSFVAAGGNPRLSSGLAGPPRNGRNGLKRIPVASPPPPPPPHVTALRIINLFIPTKTIWVVSFFTFWGIDRISGGGREEFVKMQMKDFGEFMMKTIKEAGVSRDRFVVFGDAKTTEANVSLESGSAAAASED